MLGGALRTLGLGPTPGGGGSPGGKTPGGPDGGLIILGGGTPTIFHTFPFQKFVKSPHALKYILNRGITLSLYVLQ